MPIFLVKSKQKFIYDIPVLDRACFEGPNKETGFIHTEYAQVLYTEAIVYQQTAKSSL